MCDVLCRKRLFYNKIHNGADKQKTLNISEEGFKWPRAESNHRHKDFQSSALPTELQGQKAGQIYKHIS